MNSHSNSPNIKRRSVLAGVILAPVATRVSAFQGPLLKETDPHPQWLVEWKRVEHAWEELPEGSVEADLAWDERERLCLLLCNTKATTIEGASAQFEYFKDDLGFYVMEMVSSDFGGVLETIHSGLKELSA
jgi:hypothetical protein